MKIYFHLNIDSFSNCYAVVNEKTSEAVIIDPGKITKEMINQLEDNHYRPVAVLVTHNHEDQLRGLKTFLKIYDADVYAAESNIFGIQTKVIHGEGRLNLAGLEIEYFPVPGHSPDSIVYKIGTVLFSGDVIGAGTIGETNSNYSKMILKRGVEQKILSQPEDTTIMPGHGPITTVAAERSFNIDI